MLTRLRVRGFKALRDVEVAFEPLTVIVGPNGCGKSSVLEAIELVRDFATRSSDFLGEGYSSHDLYSRGATGSHVEVSLAIKVKEAIKEFVELLWEHADSEPKPSPFYRLLKNLPAFVRSPPKPLEVATDELRATATLTPADPSFGDPNEFRFVLDPPPLTAEKDNQSLIDDYVSSIHRLALETGAIASPSHLPETEPHVRRDGGGVATVLNWLLGERDERFDAIEARLREFVPEIRRIRTRRVSIRHAEAANVKVGVDDEGREIFAKKPYQHEEPGHEVVIDYEHAEGVPASHASEGTLLLLGMLTAIHTSQASTLLVDDIERGLHPKTQQQLLGYLETLTADGLQVIATSHSPYLLLHLDYAQVRAMTLAGAEGSKIGRLTEHPEYERWKEEMSPGEFWTVFGEEWLRGQKAGD